ncbi:MAG: hypothetical protein ACTSWR_11225 [Candidatus Helarchaeota archaeon]
MGSDILKKRNYSRNELFLIRKEKLISAIISAKKILKASEPLEIADEFFHNSFKLMEKIYHIKYPNMNQEEIQQIIKNNLQLSYRLKHLRKRGINSW